MVKTLSNRDVTFGTGVSESEDEAEVATEVVRSALAGRTPTGSDLFLAFPATGYDMAALAAALQEEAAPARVVGCSAFGSFVGSRATKGCTGIYVPAGGCSFGVAASASLGADIFGSSQDAVARALAEAGEEYPYTAVVLLTDGFAGDQREVVRGAYSVTGAMIPLVGGAAAASLDERSTYQFASGEVMANGMVAIAINSPTPLGVGVHHGWLPTGESMIVTRSEGNVVWELDGQPAADLYFAQLGERPAAAKGRAPIAVMHRPIGIVAGAGRYEVRHVVEIDPRGGLAMFGYVGEGAVVRVMSGDVEHLVDAAKRSASEAAASLSSPSRGALVFSCAARAAALGPEIAREAEAVSAGLGTALVGGFFTFGEFARVKGSSGFHNATIAVLAL